MTPLRSRNPSSIAVGASGSNGLTDIAADTASVVAAAPNTTACAGTAAPSGLTSSASSTAARPATTAASIAVAPGGSHQTVPPTTSTITAALRTRVMDKPL